MILEDLALVIPWPVYRLKLQIPLGGLDQHLRPDGAADLPCYNINSISSGLSLEQVVHAMEGRLQRVGYFAGHYHTSLARSTVSLR